MNQPKFVILDRDGVINQEGPDHVRSPEEWLPIPGSLEAIARLNKAGYRVFVSTNQSGIARGYFDIETLSLIHKKMQDMLAELGGKVEMVLFCPHGPADDCSCRKPKPGMLHDLEQRLGSSLVGVPFVGDALRDLQAGIAVGAHPVLVLTGKGQLTLEENKGMDFPDVYENLAAFADAWISGEAQHHE